MRVSFCPDYYVPLPDGHPFPMGKFRAYHRILLEEELIRAGDVHAPDPAAWATLELAHTAAYLESLRRGTLDRRAQRKMGLPWSARLVYRSRLAVQGTLNAARMALADGIAANLAGGTHHAYPDHGEGYCVLNDVGVAVRALLVAGDVRRVLVIDLDVHQGNGTAAIFNGSRAVYTFSMHGERNYPWHKETSSCDVGLPDGTDDALYLRLLSQHLPGAFELSKPDLVLYLAGVDVVAGDRFGRLAMTRAGLRARDRMVLAETRRRGVPVVLLMAGGYARTPRLTADLHAEAHRAAQEVYCG